MPACEDWIAYHGLSTTVADPMDYRFGGLDTHPEGIHVGSLKQAKMRSSGHPILKIRVKGSHMSQGPVRVKERLHDWRSITKRHARNGASALVYLNRCEGVSSEVFERIDAAMKHRGGWDAFDRLSDAKARNIAPELEDSWIILDPRFIEIVGVLAYDEAKSMLDGSPTDMELEAPSQHP
jgi:hypothetical protein